MGRGRGTEVRREGDEIPPREGDAENVTLSQEFFRRYEHVTTL
jgi:hypothetical protein